MTLTLALPDPSAPIKTYANGIKVYRLHNFLGPARASLTTVSDPWSLCGTVVREAQTVSFTGTIPNKTIQTNLAGAGAGDTVRISLAGLTLDPMFGYRVYISARIEGAPDPSVANTPDNFYAVSVQSAALNIGRWDGTSFSGSSFGGATYAPKPLTNPHYKILGCIGNPGYIEGAFFNPGDSFAIRAGTGTGGSVVWYLDCMYLLPVDADTFDTPVNPYADADFRKNLMSDQNDPILDRPTSAWDYSRDDSTIDWTNGPFSVMVGAPDAWGIGNSQAEADFQDGEDEKTNYNVYGGISTINTAFDVPTDLSIIFGSQFTETHEIDRDDFDRTRTNHPTAYLGTTQKNRIYTVMRSNPMASAGATAGYLTDGTQLIMQDAKYSGLANPYVFPSPDPTNSDADNCILQLGGFSVEGGNGATTNQGHETLLGGMTACSFEIMVSVDWLLNAQFQMIIGFCPATTADRFVGVALDRPTNGVFENPTLNLRGGLMYVNTINGVYPNNVWLAGPDTLTTSFAVNQWWHVKVEFTWYRMRAKAWLDGNSEPGSWQWDIFLPIGGTTAGILYPWTTDSQRGLGLRSRPNLVPTFGMRFFAPIESNNGKYFLGDEAAGVALTSTFWKQLRLNYNAGGSTPNDVNLKLQKFDGSSIGSVTVDPYSQRMAFTNFGTHTNDNLKQGVGISLWKNAGAPTTQAVVLSDGWQKIQRVFGAFVSAYKKHSLR